MQIKLKVNRERRLKNHHPWVFKDDVEETTATGTPGDVGKIVDNFGGFVGMAYINAKASIPGRILSLRQEAINLDFYRTRIKTAIARRKVVNSNAARLINAESDGLPGLIVDKFGETLAVQFRNAGTEQHREIITEALRRETNANSAFERSDTSERTKEGLQPHTGTLWGEIPEHIEFIEDDIQFRFSPTQGQKTGYFLDQRDNRRRMASMVDKNSRLLDLYSYTGGFSLHAAKQGAKCLAVDKDAIALAALESTARTNGLDKQISVRLGDALEVLDQLVREQKKFTHAIIDPPTLAKRKDEVVAAKRIFSIATKQTIKMLEANSTLAVSTCAYHIKLDDLLEATRIGAGDAGRKLEVLDVTFQPADHPWMLQMPETLYLKTVWLRVE